MRAKPRSAHGRRRSAATASSGAISPDRTPSSNRLRASSSTAVLCCAMPRIAFLGPLGTFTEEALLSQPDLAAGELVPERSIPDVLLATERGEVDLGFVAIENAIEGTVTAAIDALAFEHELLIHREVVIPVHQNLLAPPGTTLGDIRAVMSYPVAT